MVIFSYLCCLLLSWQRSHQQGTVDYSTTLQKLRSRASGLLPGRVFFGLVHECLVCALRSSSELFSSINYSCELASIKGGLRVSSEYTSKFVGS